MRRLLRLGPCIFLLAAAGCVPGSTPAFDNDPLFNGPRVSRNNAAARPVASAPAPLPSAGGPSGPAALAAAVPASDSSSLRIAPAPAALTSAPHDGDAWRPSTSPAGVVLQQPQPLVGPPPRPIAEIAGPTGPPSTQTQPVYLSAVAADNSDQYARLQSELTQRGVLFESLEGPDDQGVWSFTCGVPKHGDPDAVHRVEASAAGDHGLAAIRAAIDKIDKDAP
jgi:hypothetical protein